MERKRRLILFTLAGIILVMGLMWRPASAQSESETLLRRIYNKLGEIISFLNSDNSADEINKKLDAILQNQAEIKEELRIIKIRATRK